MNEIIIGLLLVVIAQVVFLTRKSTNKSIRGVKHPIFVDTSVLIDGRILAIAGSGFITGTLYIPRSVIGELQFLADNADADKRARARHGLDVAKELQIMKTVQAELFQDATRAENGVDDQLLKLAKEYDGMICTIDFNLNKVAQVEEIQVLNVNELAQQLRASFLPGETTPIHLLQKGQDSHQAVGYLEDGTMVVVEHASKLLNSTVNVEVIRSLQTTAGRMMFAKLVDQPEAAPKVAESKARGRKPMKGSDETKSTRPQKQSRNKKSRRPASSAEREASLIDLVEQQYGNSTD